MYVEYLQEFWYTAEVEEETKTITFLLSWVDEPLSFTQKEFISTIGLRVRMNHVHLPLKETVRAGLATLGLFDKDKPTLSSTVLVNSSPLKDKPTLSSTVLVNSSPLKRKDKYISNDLTLVKPHTIIATSFQKPLASEVSLTSHMLKVAKFCQEPEKSLILSSEEKKIPSSSQPKSQRKVRITLLKKQVAETQHAEVKVATANATKSLEASVLAEELKHLMLTLKVLNFAGLSHPCMKVDLYSNYGAPADKVDKKIKAIQETSESPYDTESEIKLVKSYFTCQIPKLQDQIMHDSDESADYESMPEDHLRSISGFKDVDSDDIQGNDASHSDHTFPYHNAFAKRLSLPDHLDHIYEEVSSLHSKLDTMESSIIHQVSDGIKSTLPALVTTALQEQLPGLLSDTLRDCLPSIIQEQFNIFYVAHSDRFARLETKLSKTLKSNMGKSVTTLVKSGMKEVRADLKSQANDIKDEPLVERLREQPTDLNIKNKESAPPASDAKQNEGKELVVHKSEEIISVEDDLYGDDKQALSKRFKITTLIPDIPNPTPRNTFLFKTTSSRFSPTPPRELTPPRDSSKLKAVATIKEPRNELVKYQEGGGSNLKMPKLKSFITLEGPISQEEYNNQIKEIKRLKYLKAEQEKSEKELRKLLNPATLKAQAEKWIEHEAKKAKIIEEYKHQISFRADILPITKISYVVNSRKEATMKITRGNNSLNLFIHLNFRLKILGFSKWLEQAQPKDSNELFQKLLEDLHIINKELAEYVNSPSRDHHILFDDNEDHSVQYKEHLESSSNEIAASNSKQEKEKPPQDSDIRQLIREECCIEHAQPKDSNELFHKLLKDLKELAEYVNSPSRDRSIFFDNNEDHSVQYKEEECCIEVCEEQKQNMEDTILELVEICRQKELYFMHDNVDDLIESALNSKLLSINLNSQRLDKKKQEVRNVVEQPAERRTRIVNSLQNFRVIHKNSISLNNTSQISPVHAITPILSTKEPEYSLSMGYEHPNTTLETESDEIIKSGVEELVPIPNECEVTSEDKRECNVPVCENSPICDDHSEIFSDSNNDDDISSDEDAFEDIEYVEASLLDPENVSLEEENVVYQEEKEFDLEEIQDVVLREKLLSINQETRSGNTTTHANDSLPEYDSFCFEIEPDQERLINVVKNDISDDSSNDPLLEEVDLFLALDNLIPRDIENFGDDSEGDIRFLEELLIDDSIPFPVNKESDFDNPSFLRPPPEPPDAEFDLEPDSGEEISVVMNDNDELECLDPRKEFDVEDNDYFPFMFVI
nr:hypothetical protein [Tanacetum cinerariifolium]